MPFNLNIIEICFSFICLQATTFDLIRLKKKNWNGEKIFHFYFCFFFFFTRSLSVNLGSLLDMPFLDFPLSQFYDFQNFCFFCFLSFLLCCVGLVRFAISKFTHLCLLCNIILNNNVRHIVTVHFLLLYIQHRSARSFHI